MEAEKKRAVVLDESRMTSYEHVQQSFIVNAPEGATPEDITDPGFWALVSYRLRPYDKVEVRADDGTWIAEVVITGCDRTWAKAFTKHVYKLTTADVSFTASLKHEVFWRGPTHRWCVKRVSDNTVVKSECSTKKEAESWLDEYEKVI